MRGARASGRAVSPNRAGTGARLLHRLLWTLVTLAALATLVCARLLTPSPTGLGTHVALGLPPCGFVQWLGLPCPTCGLTTAFAHLARLEVLASLRAHPLGLPLFALTCALATCGAIWARRGDRPAEVLDRLQADRWPLALVVTLLVTWLSRLLALSFR